MNMYIDCISLVLFARTGDTLKEIARSTLHCGGLARSPYQNSGDHITVEVAEEDGGVEGGRREGRKEKIQSNKERKQRVERRRSGGGGGGDADSGGGVDLPSYPRLLRSV